MKKGGFGRNPGCGMTAEGAVFLGRNKAVKAVFEAYLRTQNHSLAQDSFSLVEKLFPEQISVMSYHDGNRENTNQTTIGEMVLYGEWLNLVETPEEWRLVNESALRDFATPPAFLSDQKLIHNKTNSSSSIVRDAAEDAVKYPAQ